MTTIAGALIVIDTEIVSEVDAVEEREHVVERVHRDAEPADFAQRARVVAIEAHQRRQVERGGEAGLPLLQQELEPLVRLSGRTEAGELPHRPEPPAVHARVHAARERVLAGISVVRLAAAAVQIVRRVQRFDRPAAHRRGRLLADRRPGQLFCPAFHLHAIGPQRPAHARILPNKSSSGTGRVGPENGFTRNLAKW